MIQVRQIQKIDAVFESALLDQLGTQNDFQLHIINNICFINNNCFVLSSMIDGGIELWEFRGKGNSNNQNQNIQIQDFNNSTNQQQNNQFKVQQSKLNNLKAFKSKSYKFGKEWVYHIRYSSLQNLLIVVYKQGKIRFFSPQYIYEDVNKHKNNPTNIFQQQSNINNHDNNINDINYINGMSNQQHNQNFAGQNISEGIDIEEESKNNVLYEQRVNVPQTCNKQMRLVQMGCITSSLQINSVLLSESQRLLIGTNKLEYTLIVIDIKTMKIIHLAQLTKISICSLCELNNPDQNENLKQTQIQIFKNQTQKLQQYQEQQQQYQPIQQTQQQQQSQLNSQMSRNNINHAYEKRTNFDLVVGGVRGELCLITNITNPKIKIMLKQAHKYEVHCVQQIQKYVFLSSSYDRKAKLWSIEGRKKFSCIKVMDFSVDNIIQLNARYCLISPFMGKSLDGVSPKIYGKNPLLLFDKEKKCLEFDKYPILEFKDYITCIAINPSQNVLALGGRPHKVKLYKLKMVSEDLLGHKQRRSNRIAQINGQQIEEEKDEYKLSQLQYDDIEEEEIVDRDKKATRNINSNKDNNPKRKQQNNQFVKKSKNNNINSEQLIINKNEIEQQAIQNRGRFQSNASCVFDKDSLSQDIQTKKMSKKIKFE